MANLPGFESLDKIKRTYPYFDLAARKFSYKKGTKYYGGVPVLYDSETRRLYLDSGDTHSLVYGATGSLKTRAVVSPTIKLLGYAGESMIINDPKGELFARHAGDLKKQGYRIIEINFRDPSVGNAWNPLFIPYQFYLDGDYDNAAAFIHDIATNLAAMDKSESEPFWDEAAADCFSGLIQLLFRYCKDHNASIHAINIGNLFVLRRALFSNRQSAQNSILWKYASEDEMVAASLSGTVYAAKETMNSILSILDRKLRSFAIRPTLLDMLANHDFDLGDITREKTAVFLITPDEKTSYHALVSMFIKQTYEYFIYRAAQRPDGKMENRLNYIIDEFSALPTIADMPAMISAARSRDIRFLLVVQSKAALKQRYTHESETIISNCTNWIFFTSRELDLLKELSELCGVQRNNLPNISIYDLQHFSKERREALVLTGRLKPAKVNMLDIDQFGDTKYVLLEHEKRDRQDREKLTFALREEIKKRYLPNLPSNPFDETNPFHQKSVSRQGVPQKTFDVDSVIRRIDRRIEELEKEEGQTAQAESVERMASENREKGE